MVKAFTPTFTAEDLTKTPNFSAVAKVMMFDMPSTPFTMKLPTPMGEPNEELMESLKAYSAAKFGKTRAEVEKEIQDRWNATEKAKKPETPPEPSKSPVDVVPVADDKIPTSAPKPAPKAPETPRKGFLDDWIAKNPAPASTAPIEPETPPSAPEIEPESQPDEAVFKIR